MISLATFSSICNSNTKSKSPISKHKSKEEEEESEMRFYERTFCPLSMHFMATSSFVSLFLISRATPKFPDPISLTSSYFSISLLSFSQRSKIENSQILRKSQLLFTFPKQKKKKKKGFDLQQKQEIRAQISKNPTTSRSRKLFQFSSLQRSAKTKSI